MNEDANAKLIRELREEISRLHDLLKVEGIQVDSGEPGAGRGRGGTEEGQGKDIGRTWEGQRRDRGGT